MGTKARPIRQVIKKSRIEQIPVNPKLTERNATGDPILQRLRRSRIFWLVIVVGVVVPFGVFMRAEFGRFGNTAPAGAGWKQTPAVLEIATLVLREGLECVLVLAAVAAGLEGARRVYRPSIAAGVGMGFAATLLTWRVAALILEDIGKSSSALAVQAGTGLLAIVVLLLVMNWFFHKLYWTGWISLHSQKKQRLLQGEEKGEGKMGISLGMASLGFTSFYREGFEVVLFLQSYRLRFGNTVVLHGVILGMFASGIVAFLTYVAHRRLPYRRMLIATGLMLTFVLLVMVGEQAQEMQLAGWLPATEIPALAKLIPSWMGFWLSVIPTVESLCAQVLAGLFVFGSYLLATARSPRGTAAAP